MRKMATEILLKPNQSLNTIQSPLSSPSPNDFFNNILIQLNEWLAFFPNLFHGFLEWLAFLPNLFHGLIEKFNEVFIQLNKWLSFLPNLFHGLIEKLNEAFIQLNEWLAFLPNLFHGLVEKFNEAFIQLNEWLAFFPNLFHGLVEKLAQGVAVATHFAIVALGVVLVLLFCCCCWPAIISCVVWVMVTCWILVKGLFMLVLCMCVMVYRACCCFGARSVKMMKALGRGGNVFIRSVISCIVGFAVACWSLICEFFMNCGQAISRVCCSCSTSSWTVIFPRAIFEFSPRFYVINLRSEKTSRCCCGAQSSESDHVVVPNA